MSDDCNSPGDGGVNDEPAYQNAVITANGSHDDNINKRASQISEQNSLNANTTVKQSNSNTITAATVDPVANSNANKTNNDNSATAVLAAAAAETAEYANGNIVSSSPTTPATTVASGNHPFSLFIKTQRVRNCADGASPIICSLCLCRCNMRVRYYGCATHI